MPWTTPAQVAAALGPTVDVDDAYLTACVDAANVAAYRKRAEAGYVDDPLEAPSADVAHGTTVWAVALYRERGSTDTFASFDDSAGFGLTGGTWPTIKRLLAIGRAQVDLPAADLPTATPLLRPVRWIR